MNLEHIASSIPFVSCVVANGGGRTPIATRLAEIALILAFVWWQVEKLDDRLAQVEDSINQVTVAVVKNAVRLDERDRREGR